MRRGATSIALAVLVVVGTSACTFMTPQSTVEIAKANIADGINATVGSIDVRNAMLLTGDGKTASFLVNFVNTSDNGIMVRVQYEGSDHTKVNKNVFVNPGSVKSLGGVDGPQLVFDNIGTNAGALLPVFIQYDEVTGQQLRVPVLNGTQAEYKDLLPSATPQQGN